jgi:hypothetical protein
MLQLPGHWVLQMQPVTLSSKELADTAALLAIRHVAGPSLMLQPSLGALHVSLSAV